MPVNDRLRERGSVLPPRTKPVQRPSPLAASFKPSRSLHAELSVSSRDLAMRTSPTSIPGPVASPASGDGAVQRVVTGTHHQQRFALMGLEGNREAVQIVDLTELFVGEHVDQQAARHQVL